MDIIKMIQQKKYYYDIYLRSLSLSNQIHVIFHGLKNELSYLERPRTLALGLTYRCQLECIHCGIEGYSHLDKFELTTREVMDVIRQAHRLGVCLIDFTGGEPLMRDDIFTLVEYTSREGLIVSLGTNGLVLTQSKARHLKKKGIAFVKISIDSIDCEIHDQLRGSAGSFQKAQDAISSCVAEDISVIVSTYATKENIRNGDIKEIILLAKKLGARGVRIVLSIPAGRWLRHIDVVLSEEDKRYVCNNLLDPQYVYIESLSGCSAILKKLLYVSPYGEVRPCIFVPLSFGNIRKEPLKNIWERMTSQTFYKTTAASDCIMRNAQFRKQYIDTIDKGQELPIRITY